MKTEEPIHSQAQRRNIIHNSVFKCTTKLKSILLWIPFTTNVGLSCCPSVVVLENVHMMKKEETVCMHTDRKPLAQGVSILISSDYGG